MQTTGFSKKLIHKVTAFAVMVSLATLLVPQVSFAAGYPQYKEVIASDNMISTASDYTIYFTNSAGVGAGETMSFQFASSSTTDFNLSTIVIGDIDLDVSAAATSSCSAAGDYASRTLAASASTTTWGVAVSGQTVTFTSDTGTIGAGICIKVSIGQNATGGSNRITNGNTVGSKTITFGGTSTTATSDAYTPLVTNNEVEVTGTVSGGITLTVDVTPIALGTLSATAVTTASSASGAIGVNTNASSGFTLTGYAPETLTHFDASTTIVRQTAYGTGSTGTAGWGIDLDEVTDSEGLATMNDSYDGSATSSAIDGTTYFQVKSSAAALVTSTAGTNATYTIRAHANIPAAQKPGAYSGMLKFGAYGNF